MDYNKITLIQEFLMDNELDILVKGLVGRIALSTISNMPPTMIIKFLYMHITDFLLHYKLDPEEAHENMAIFTRWLADYETHQMRKIGIPDELIDNLNNIANAVLKEIQEDAKTEDADISVFEDFIESLGEDNNAEME
jgi:hypothetical protein